MKTITTLSFLAALVAFALSIINVEVACAVMSVAGLLGIMSVDYSRGSRALERCAIGTTGAPRRSELPLAV